MKSFADSVYIYKFAPYLYLAMRKITAAIDPDIEKSGLAFYDGETMGAYSVCFPMLIEQVRQKALECELTAYVEAGWLNDGHWHLPRGCSLPMAASLGNSVGRNHETGRKIVEMLRFYGINVKEVRPLKKFWSGKDKKITLEELNRQLMARKVPPLKRCSQDARDAALIALVYHD